MSIFRPSPKKLALTFVGLVVLWLGFAWLALPRILQSQAQHFIAEKTGHHLALDTPEFNPFELRLRIPNFRLEDPEGKLLLAFRELVVDLSAASIGRRAVVFDSIRLDGPQASVVLQGDGRLNWSRLIEALKSKEAQSDTALPRVDVEHFVLAGGRLDFADRKSAFETRVEPLDLELSDISTLPDAQEQGRYQISARTALGARVNWQGALTLNPIVATGKLGIEELDLARLAPYLKDGLPSAPAGVASLTTDYRATYGAGKFDLSLDQIGAKLTNLRLKTGLPAGRPGVEIIIDSIEAQNGHYGLAQKRATLGALSLVGSQVHLARAAGGPLKLLQLGSLALEDLQADLAGHQLTLGRLALKDGQLKAVRNAAGQIDVQEALQGKGAAKPQQVAAPKSAQLGAKNAPAPAASPSSAPSPAWKFRLDKFELAGFTATFVDQSVKPGAEIVFEDIHLAADGISENLAAPLPVRAGLRARDGGSLEVSGKLTPASAAADLQFKLADLALKPVQPYLSPFVKLKLGDGKLGVDGSVTYDQRGPSFKGGFALRDLRLSEAESGKLFLAWKSLATRDLKADAKSLDIGTLVLDGVDTNILIDKNKSINVSHLLVKPQEQGEAGKPSPAAASVSPPPSAASAPKAAPAFRWNIDRLRVRNGELEFADHSLALPFGTRIHRLRGAVNGLTTRPGSPGQVELDGQVDDYGLARAVGQIDLSDPTGFTDLKVVFRNVEMKRLTPYSATFAGRKIESGKLSLNLEYKIKQRQLTGDNQIIMDQLTLGERVEAPEAKNLPLDLAIAILRDSDGRIDLGLPVSGSLDDPQFSYGGIVWKAILNVFAKIATAPFRMLGSLFGGGEKLEKIAFEAGDAKLTPPEREKFVRLAGILNKRPALALTVHGVYAEADRVALQDRQLRRAVAEHTGQRLEKSAAGDTSADPGPLSTQNPKVQAALESLYAERLGRGELAALKDGFRKANPGQLEESAAGKVMSRLSGLFREQRVLNEQEVTQLKGADFHAVLFEQLRARETVSDAQLQTLAKLRGENVAAALAAASAPAERLTLGAPEKVDAAGRDIPVKLELGAAAKVAAPAVVPPAAPATNPAPVGSGS